MQYPSTFPLILESLTRLSFQAMGYSSPNPPVACVITDLNGNFLGEGHTGRVGENHAEREAYRCFALKFPDKAKIPHLLFVTMEPCTHQGRTPPCLDLILEYKPVCVYYGLTDPNPLVKKKDGFKECEKVGVSVIHSPEIETIGRAFLTGFISKIENARPQFFIKSALSKEGYYADLARSKISLSNRFSNQVTQMLRAKLDAVIVGPVTVYVDDPGLDFRGFEFNAGDQEYLHSTINPFDEIDGRQTLFTESILRNISSSKSVDWHSKHLPDYQPYRVFILSLKRIPDQSFFQKQTKLFEKFGERKSVFFLLDFDSNNLAHRKLYKAMEEFSYDMPIIVSDRSELFEKLLTTFSNLSLNTILIEGGNLLYKTFAGKLSKEDRIYYIRTEASILKGILPDIDLSNKKKLYEKKIDTDIWEVYGE